MIMFVSSIKRHYRETFSIILSVVSIMSLLLPEAGFCSDVERPGSVVAWPSEISGWRWDGEKSIYSRDNLYEHIDGAAEVYLSYNFQRASVRRYTKSGSPPIIAELYELGSSADAFGVFSLEQQDPEVGIGQGSEFGGSLLRFWKGRYFVSILAEGGGREIETAVLDLGKALADSITETGEVPRLLRYLPDVYLGTSAAKVCFLHNHILLNRCFFLSHENILKLDRDVDAVVARYLFDKVKTHVLLVHYPSRERARSAFVSFRNAYMPKAGKDSVVKTEGGLWTKSDLYGEFLIVVFGAPRQSDADYLWGQVIGKLKGEAP